MSELVRLYRYKSLFDRRIAVSAENFMAALEVFRAPRARDSVKLRNQP